MKRLIILSSLIPTAFVLSAQQYHGRMHPLPALGAMGQVSRTPITGAPYSATETVQTQQTLANGNQISRNEQLKVYRDGQGRTRTERTITPAASTGKQPFTQITITDPVAGYRYMLNSSTMTALQMPLPKPNTTTTATQPAGSHPRLNGAEVSTTDLGMQTVNGVTATGTQTNETIPAGAIGNRQPIQITRVVWTSTALKIPVQVKTSDPRFGTSDREVTNIAQVEPDPSLFAVPSGYTVKTVRFGGGGHARPSH